MKTFHSSIIAKIAFLLLSGFLLLNGYSLSAQWYQSPNRSKWMGGFAVGSGWAQQKGKTFQYEGFDLALNWKIGHWVRPKWALLLNGAVSVYPYNGLGRDRKRDFGGLFPGVQYQVQPRWWLQAGLGAATDAPVFFDLDDTVESETKYHWGLGGMMSTGYELLTIRKMVVDVQLRLQSSAIRLPEGKSTGYSAAVLLGVHWH